jgi:hypothetical protein
MKRKLQAMAERFFHRSPTMTDNHYHQGLFMYRPEDPAVRQEFTQEIAQALLHVMGKSIGFTSQELATSIGLRELIHRNMEWFSHTPDWMKLVSLILAKKLNKNLHSSTIPTPMSLDHFSTSSPSSSLSSQEAPTATTATAAVSTQPCPFGRCFSFGEEESQHHPSPLDELLRVALPPLPHEHEEEDIELFPEDEEAPPPTSSEVVEPTTTTKQDEEEEVVLVVEPTGGDAEEEEELDGWTQKSIDIAATKKKKSKNPKTPKAPRPPRPPTAPTKKKNMPKKKGLQLDPADEHFDTPIEHVEGPEPRRRLSFSSTTTTDEELSGEVERPPAKKKARKTTTPKLPKLVVNDASAIPVVV